MTRLEYSVGLLLSALLLIPGQVAASSWSDRIQLSADIVSEFAFETDSGPASSLRTTKLVVVRVAATFH